jgi:hypothetical protein
MDLEERLKDVGRNSVYDKEKGEILVGKKKYNRGATKLLKNIFYANEKKAFLKRRSANSSSAYEGKSLHRAIYHRYMCSKSCCCVKKFKDEIKTPPPPFRPDTVKGRKLKALRTWLAKMNLILIACECPVGWREARAATYLDAVCIYADSPKDYFILEFKTGYPPSVRTRVLTKNGTKTMLGEGGKKIKCHDLNKHRLQLWFGMNAFENTYKVAPKDGAVIYFQKITAPKQGYACFGYILSECNWFNEDTLSKLKTQLIVCK